MPFKNIFLVGLKTFCNLDYKMRPEKILIRLRECAPNEDSNKAAHLRSLTSLRFPFEEILQSWLTKLSKVRQYAQWRFWSDLSDVMADLNLRWAHIRRYNAARLYWKFYHQKMKIFIDKKNDIFHISAQKHRLWVLIRSASYTLINLSFTI